MSRDLLKEAIADAKAVKETAIANAKAYLEEAFTPQLRSMLAAKLEEMDEETDDIEEGQPANRKGDEDDSATEMAAERDRRKNKDVAAMREEEELDLDEILSSLEEEDDEITEKDDPLEKAVGKTERDDYEKGKEEGEEDEEDKEEDEEEIDIEDMTSDDLKSFIETVIADMVEAGELEAGEEVEGEEVEVEDEFSFDDEVEISEIGDDYKTGNALNPVEKATFQETKKGNKEEQKRAMGAIEDNDIHREKLAKDTKFQRKKLAKLKKDAKEDLDENYELEEAYSTIKTLKSELNEINLLNAKLLYTNKIFKSKNLTEAQKVKILNAFDKAGSVKEVKIVFETLNENIKIKTTKSQIREHLGFASKATGRTKRTAKPVVETDPMVARFKKLAGLT